MIQSSSTHILGKKNIMKDVTSEPVFTIVFLLQLKDTKQDTTQ